MNYGIAFKKSKKAYLVKINFVTHQQIIQLMIKIMNMFVTFEKY